METADSGHSQPPRTGMLVLACFVVMLAWVFLPSPAAACEHPEQFFILAPSTASTGVALNAIAILEQGVSDDLFVEGLTFREAEGGVARRIVPTRMTFIDQIGGRGRLVILKATELFRPNSPYGIYIDTGQFGFFRTGDAVDDAIPQAPEEVARSLTPLGPVISFCSPGDGCSSRNMVSVQSNARVVVAVPDGTSAANIIDIPDGVLSWAVDGQVPFALGDGCLTGSETFRLAAVGPGGALSYSRAASQTGTFFRASCAQVDGGSMGALGLVLVMGWRRRCARRMPPKN